MVNTVVAHMDTCSKNNKVTVWMKKVGHNCVTFHPDVDLDDL